MSQLQNTQNNQSKQITDTIYIKISGKEIKCTIVRHSNRKSIKVLVNKGTVKVFVPSKTNDKQLKFLLAQHGTVIYDILEKEIKLKEELIKKISLGEYHIAYLGKKIPVTSTEFLEVPIRFDEHEIRINKRYIDYADVLLNRLLRKKAEEYIHERTKYIAYKNGFKFARIKIKDTKTRWGSCSSKGTISLNWRLIMAPVEVIDYVIIHELAHTVEMNHGKKFWEVVGRYFPNWKLCRDWLKKNGHNLSIP